MKKSGFLLVTILCFGLFSCIKQAPQLPSNKVIERNTDNATLLKINNALTHREDSLIRIVAERNGTFKKSPIGFWYKIFHTGHGTTIKDSAICMFDFQSFKLDNTLIKAGSEKIIIGKKQAITGIEEGLKMMQTGDSATFIIPWYLAFGMAGDNEVIPPYTSLICKIKVRN